MPAFLYHYACGVKAFHTLPDGVVRRAIRQHPSVYAIGLAGPDIFFYSLPQWIRKDGMTTGRIMHIRRTGTFLQTLYHDLGTRADEEEQDIAVAYLAGFLGHYSLDCCAHALVYRICKDESETVALGRHFRYEAAMDRMCCRQVLGRDINEHPRQVDLIRLCKKERRVISEMVSGAIREVYPDMVKKPGRRRMQILLWEYYLLSGQIADPSGFKEWLVLKAERLFPGYPLVSPLLINRNTYGLDGGDWKRFEIRFNRGWQMHARLLKAMEETLSGRCTQDRFFALVGSRSYHDGKPVS